MPYRDPARKREADRARRARLRDLVRAATGTRAPVARPVPSGDILAADLPPRPPDGSRPWEPRPCHCDHPPVLVWVGERWVCPRCHAVALARGSEVLVCLGGRILVRGVAV